MAVLQLRKEYISPFFLFLNLTQQSHLTLFILVYGNMRASQLGLNFIIMLLSLITHIMHGYIFFTLKMKYCLFARNSINMLPHNLTNILKPSILIHGENTRTMSPFLILAKKALRIHILSLYSTTKQNCRKKESAYYENKYYPIQVPQPFGARQFKCSIPNKQSSNH